LKNAAKTRVHLVKRGSCWFDVVAENNIA